MGTEIGIKTGEHTQPRFSLTTKVLAQQSPNQKNRIHRRDTEYAAILIPKIHTPCPLRLRGEYFPFLVEFVV
jgi:hypothetical protein